MTTLHTAWGIDFTQHHVDLAAGWHCWLAQQWRWRCNGVMSSNESVKRPHRKQVRHFDEPGHVHELTFSCYRRQPLLLDDTLRSLFCQSLDRAISRHDFRLFAFVIMPEHVHLLVQPRQSTSRVSDLLFAVKRPFSYRAKQVLQRSAPTEFSSLMIRQRPKVTTFRFWQEGGGYDRNLTEPKAILASIDYIHANPTRRGLCDRAVDWKWSSARWFFLEYSPHDPDLPRLTPLPPDLLM